MLFGHLQLIYVFSSHSFSDKISEFQAWDLLDSTEEKLSLDASSKKGRWSSSNMSIPEEWPACRKSSRSFKFFFFFFSFTKIKKIFF